MCGMLQVCGKPVGVHISRGRSVDQLVEDQIVDVQDDADPDASVNKLLRLLRSHTDRKAAISAALKAVLTLPSRKVVPAETPVPVESSPPVSEPPPEPIPDPDSFLDSFLRCKHLVETFRANPSTHNKTPLAILHEYATRLGLEVCSSLTWLAVSLPLQSLCLAALQFLLLTNFCHVAPGQENVLELMSRLVSVFESIWRTCITMCRLS